MSQSTHDLESPPPLIYGLTEGSRTMAEYAWFVAARPWLARGRQGDGRPVLVLPGLTADDRSTAPLRRLLASVGYEPHPWGLGWNVGPTEKIIGGMDTLLGRLRDRYGAPVSVIGQSLGGIFARELARRHPGAVERLVTLGSPVAMTSQRQSRATRTYLRNVGEHLPEFAFERWIKAPQPRVPSTSIYSRSDGIVRWEACQCPEGPLTENIEVVGSHCGLCVHPAAVYAVLDRLEEPLDDWQKFAAPTCLRAYFPARLKQAS